MTRNVRLSEDQAQRDSGEKIKEAVATSGFRGSLKAVHENSARVFDDADRSCILRGCRHIDISQADGSGLGKDGK